MPCNQANPKAKDPNYECNEKTGRWNKKKKAIVVVQPLPQPQPQPQQKTPCNPSNAKAKDPNYECNEKTKRWVKKKNLVVVKQCDQNNPKAKDQNYECNQKTGHWVKKKVVKTRQIIGEKVTNFIFDPYINTHSKYVIHRANNIYKGLLSSLKSLILPDKSEEEKTRINFQKWKSLPYPIFNVDLSGCTSVYQYFIKTSKSVQQIISVGEYHTDKVPENFVVNLLQNLSKTLECPIHVLFEAQYHKHAYIDFLKPSDLAFKTRSLISLPFFQTDIIHMKQDQLDITTDFTHKHLTRYGGKVKAWGNDLRHMYWFPLLYKLDEKMKKDLLQVTFDIT
jgi:hypothetical protein